MCRDISHMESCQLTSTGGFSDLTINCVGKRHHWPVFGDLRNRTSGTDIRKEPGRGPKCIYFSVVFYSIYTIQMVGVVQRIRKCNGSEQDQKSNMNVSVKPWPIV